MASAIPSTTINVHERIEASLAYSSIGAKLFLDPETADVHFIVGKQDEHCERIPAHKLFLITGSDVFHIMFDGFWKEKDDHEVRIVDATAAAFKVFLQFFYMNEVELSTDTVLDVMNLGKKYCIAHCLDSCVNFLRITLTDENVLWVYEITILFELGDLRQICEKLIGINTGEILKSSSFLQCDKAVVRNILKLDALNCTEIALFKATMCWVEAKNNGIRLNRQAIRKELGILFEEFRFGSMNIEEFITLIPKYGHLFSAEEYQDIIHMSVRTKYKPGHFNRSRNKRMNRAVWNGQDFVRSDRLVSKYPSLQPYYIRSIENTTFSTSEMLLLQGFECTKLLIFNQTAQKNYSAIDQPISTEIEIVQMLSTKVRIVLSSLQATFNPGSSLKIELPKPILIKPGLTYQIRFKQQPPRNCCSNLLLKSSVPSVQFHCCAKVENDDAARDLVKTLLFYKI